MKKAKLFLTAVIAAFTMNANAQCLSTNLNISTGYSAAAGGPVTPSNTQSDPEWTSAVSPAAAAAISLMGDLVGCYDALPCPSWPPSLAGTTWVMGQNDWGYNTNGSGGFGFTDTFTRHFTMCGSDSITLKIPKILCDDGILEITLDGTVLYSTSTPPAGVSTYPGYGLGSSLNLGTLSTGTHALAFVIYNLNNGVYKNAVGIDINGTLISNTGTSSLVSDTCPNYTCVIPDSCEETCYWKLTGNHINPGHNLLGTLTNDDINIITNSTLRAIVKSSGFVGIDQSTPSTTLDVQCIPPSSAPSGLRFENLPNGQGNVLVIDASGYVYVEQNAPNMPAQSSDLQSQINDLKQQIQDLKAQLGQNVMGGSTQNTSTFSISPNPTSGEINATYLIPQNFANATIKITDNLGRVIVTTPVTNNSGTIQISIPAYLQSTTLIAALIVDGNAIASKQISYIKN